MSCYEGDDARGKGLARYFLQFVPNLPLRGKLGWMTPRAGVKTTLASEMRLPGLPDPKRGAPLFFSHSSIVFLPLFQPQ